MLRIVALWWGMCALTLLAPHPAFGQETNRAGLVIVHGDGAAVSRCVAFESDSISGYELLTQSGLDVNVEASGMGATICRLDGEGCNSPRESCFCQCQGGAECLYWSYWQAGDDEWRYSNLGASNSRVTDGAVEGWVWGEGQAQSKMLLPDLTFADICPQTTENEPVAAQPVIVASSSDATAQPAPFQATGVSDEAADADAEAPPGFEFLLVLLPAPLLAGLYWLRQRKGAA
jgi:hypothetical protein